MDSLRFHNASLSVNYESQAWPEHVLAAEVHEQLRKLHDQGKNAEEMLKSITTAKTPESYREHIRFWAGLYAASPRNPENVPDPLSSPDVEGSDEVLSDSETDDPMEDSVSVVPEGTAPSTVPPTAIHFAVPAPRIPVAAASVAASAATSSTIALGPHTQLRTEALPVDSLNLFDINAPRHQPHPLRIGGAVACHSCPRRIAAMQCLPCGANRKRNSVNKRQSSGLWISEFANWRRRSWPSCPAKLARSSLQAR